MKKTIKILVLTTLASSTGLAAAQTSVTFSGRVDAGFAYLSKVQTSPGVTASRFSAQNGDWGVGMFNFSGTEDLGDGNKAIFIISDAVKAMTGMAGASFRKSFVGLSNNDLGTIKLGRDLFISNGVTMIDPFVQELFGSASLVRGRNWQQTNSNITYLSPSFGGFDIALQNSVPGQPGNFNAGAPGGFGRTDGIQLTYKSNLFDIRAIYDEMRDSNGRFSNVFTSSKELVVGANLRVDKFVIQGAVTRMVAADTPAGLAKTANHYWLGFNYVATPALLLTAGAYHIDVGNGNADATHDGHGHATIFEVGSTYNLSKRTFLYATAGYLKNGAHSTFSLEPNSPGLNNNNLDNPLPGHTQVGSYIGINHSF